MNESPKVPGMPSPPSGPLSGLTSEEASRRLVQYGPNAVAEEKPHPLLAFLGKFWAPVPWMLEATVALELVLGKVPEAVIIGVLLLFNALLGLVQERRAQSALAVLRQHLSVQGRVQRDGKWTSVPAADLVPGDAVHLRMGDLVPADVRLTEGQIEMDQSALTGESAPVEGGPGATALAGAVVKRGEATGEVTATGARSKFGKTAELVRTAKTASHLESTIFSIVKYLITADAILVVLVSLYALHAGLSWHVLLPFALILLVASVPVALPATFTLATALGASDLARHGVLSTRLSAIEEAAAMTVLASDKTGTITLNQLSLAGVRALAPHTEEEVLRWGAWASEPATQDPLDMAILKAAEERKIDLSGDRLHFTPFDPATKRSEALVRLPGGGTLRIVKGAAGTIAALAGPAEGLQAGVADLAKEGCRVLAVAAGPPEGPLLVGGLLGLQDPPRPDARALIQHLRDLGVRVLMVTGDDPLTAQAVAGQVGIQGTACSAEGLHGQVTSETLKCDIFAGVFPEDKFHLVKALQAAGHVVGMTGDGVNDAPALRQAEVGVAVSSATDVAKASASLVLTAPGLGNIVDAVQTSRRIYQRMLTYTLNKIIKTFQITLFLSLGLVVSKVLVLTPMLMILLLFANDFITMSITTDRVTFHQKPDRWAIRPLMIAASALALPLLAFSFGLFCTASVWMHLPLPQVQTLMFVMLALTGQGIVYLVRERRHFWHSLPSGWMLGSTALDVAAVSAMAVLGILMAAVPWTLVGLTLGATLVFLVLLDFLKIPILAYCTSPDHS
ncbi:MAG: plasma-membrane proton-efflux P-type ATPase [Candidatus Krumholzibacteriia bacterium]